MTTSRDHKQNVCRKPSCLMVVVVLVMAICFTRHVAAQTNATTTSSGNDSSTQPPDNTTTSANNTNAPDPTTTVSGEVNTTTRVDTAAAGDKCHNDTCGAHGTCNDSSGHVMCVCEEGWTGTNCTDDVNECTLMGVCQNELYCENRVGGYKCNCLTGWQGDTCTEDIDECTPALDPCPDPKANCSNANGSFTCVCHHGYERLAPNTNCTEQVLLPYNTSGTRRDHGDDEMFGPFPIPYGFQLDGQTVLNYYVSINGYITFNTRFSSPRMPDVTSPQLSPLSFIAPYWADIHIPEGSATSGLYHVTLSLEDTYADNETRAEFDRYTDMAALGDDFHPVFIAVVTWVDVRPYNAEDFTHMQGATFQVMLATDGRRMTSRLAWRTVWPDSDQLHVTAWTHLTDSTKQDLMPLTNLPRNQTATSSTDPGNSSAAQCIDWRHKQGRSLPRGPPQVACPCSLEQAKRDGLFQVNEMSRCATSNVYDVTTGMKQVCCYSPDTDMIDTDPFSAQPPVLMTREQNATIWDGHSNCCVPGAPMMCAAFHELFPLDTCATYSAPVTALLWGDPHLVTLDGAQYTLNGWGEYDVLKPPAITNRSLHVQGRTHKLQGANVTIFTAFAFKYNDTVLQVQHAGNQSLAVYVSGEVVTPPSGVDSAAWGDVHVELTTSMLDVVFPTRVAVRITAMFDRLSLTFSAHMDTLRQSLGLLGLVDGDVTNDYQLRNGTTLNASDLTPDSVFRFGQSWLIQDEEASIFHYNLSGKGDNFTSNQHPEFTPLLLPLTLEALLSQLNQTAGHLAVGEALCDGSTACLHDLLATKNNVTAMETRDTQRLAIRTAVILGQKPPQFVDQQALWNVTLTSAVFRHNIVVKVEESNNTIYPNVSADVTATGIDLNYTLSHQQSGTWELVWYLSEDDRNLTNLTLRFKAVSSVTNMTSYYTPDIVLCACVREEECDYLVSSLALSASNGSGMFYVAGCQCGLDKGGRFCQDDVSVCDVCYDNSTCDADLTQGNVCTKCPDGFLGDGVKCYEVDECRQTSPCNQQCANTVGSFNCSCHVGFTLVNATSCQDLNECTAQLDNCSTNSNEFCMNTEGGFECVCRPGFGGDTCTEKVSHVYGGQLLFLALADKGQEWSPDLNNIHTPAFKQLASKVQHVVSQLLSNKTIPHVSVVVMAFELVSSNRRRRSNDGGPGQRIKARFQVAFNTTQPVPSLQEALTSGFDPQCVEDCLFGFDRSTPMLYGVSRQDSRFDESYDLCGSDRNNKCHDDSTVCATEDGAAICRCRHGYQAWDLYDYACQDVNECQTNTTQQLCGLTEPNSTECLNTVGSYYCTCPKTHRWDAGTMRCAQLSSVCEANSSPCLNGGQCVTTTDSLGYTCRCKDGWSGLDCGDEDEEAKKLKTTLIIVGSVLGGVCLLLLVAVLAMCFVRSRRRTHSKAWRPSYDNGGAIPRPLVRSSGAYNGSDPDNSNPMQRQDSMHKYTDFRGGDPDVNNGASRDNRGSGAQQYTNPVFTRDEDNSKL